MLLKELQAMLEKFVRANNISVAVTAVTNVGVGNLIIAQTHPIKLMRLVEGTEDMVKHVKEKASLSMLESIREIMGAIRSGDEDELDLENMKPISDVLN